MSESDDSDLFDIQADIQALDEVLALSAKKKSQQHVSNSQHSDISSDVDTEDNDDCVHFLHTNREIKDSLNAYEINTRLITGLTIAKKKLIALLEECEQKMRLLDEKMKFRVDSNLGSKLAISNAGIPYFKDKDYFSVPKNIDTKRKETSGEVFLLNLKKPNRWSGKDRETLLNAINNQAIETVLSGEFNEEIGESTSVDKAKKTKLVIPRNFNEMVGPSGEKEFDWYKISVIDFDNKHSPGECRAMWNVYLHPDFKKSEWTNAEDKKLLKCVREYKCQDWDAIAQKLDTNRSAYQCFIRYNTIKKMPSTGRPWTKQEDRHLMKIINTLKIGDYISWAEVANHLRHRTKQQIYVRWMYSKAPHLRKGRFTCAETTTLLKAVQKYGMDFCKISNAVMPHRTSVQLQGRYHTVMTNVNNWNVWTLNDDMTLINLHMKYNNKWSRIAKYFSDKTRIQVRHRYNALLKYITRGISLESIPRPPPTIRNRKDVIKNKKLLADKAPKLRIKNILPKMQPVNIFDIQFRLYETLCFPPSIKPNNSEDELYDIEQLTRDTKRLYDTLNLLNVNLVIPDDFLNYVQLNNREKQLLASLKEYANVRCIQNNELIENFRIRMFGYDSEINESDFFIPPLPFDGYVKLRKTIKNQKNTSIDYDLNVNDEKFLIDVPEDFFITPSVLPLISIEEEIQFDKLSQFLISDHCNFLEQNVDLYKSIKCIFSFAKSTSNETSSEYNILNVNSELSSEDYEQVELNKFKKASRSKAGLDGYELNKCNKEAVSSKEDDEEINMGNVIPPNQATLLGLKNLFLWKILHDYQHDSHVRCELIASFARESKSEQTTTNSRSIEVESAEYQLLRARLWQLFQVPIGLSNTILEVYGPEAIFSKQEPIIATFRRQLLSRKRKFKEDKDINLLQLNQGDGSNVLANSDSMRNLPRIRSHRIVRKKYIITKK